MKNFKIHEHVPSEYGQKVFSRRIASELTLKNSIIEEIMSLLRERDLLDEEDEVWSRLCLDEILINAIKHGNKEDSTKNVDISLFLDDARWSIRVEDEGEGFSLDDIPDPNADESWELEHGRGITLMQSYMDEVWYYDKGNRVQLTKCKKNWFRKLVEKTLGFLRLK